jgi:release factor glutamine methyltransferase
MRKTIASWISDAAGALASITEDEDRAWIEARRLTAFWLKKSESHLIAHGETALTATQQNALNGLLKRRMNHEPMEYILGSAIFMGHEFVVDKRVLIPRQETEDILLKIDRRKTNDSGTLIVDIGTGSGALAISCALEFPKVMVFASDTDTNALIVAKKNAHKLAPKRIRFFHGPLLHPSLIHAIATSSKVSSLLLLANLPYLPASDRTVMPMSVIKYEPSKALFAKDKGMEFNKRLLSQVSQLLMTSLLHDSSLAILLEFDPPQSKKLLAFAKSLFPAANISIMRDRCGRERVLSIKLPIRQKSRLSS